MNKERHYQILIKGVLNRKWENWFEGFKIKNDQGNTLLTGSIKDQSSLYGLFIKLRDLGLVLLSVNSIRKNDEKPEGGNK